MTRSAGSWHVEVDQALCMGTGACAHAKPDVFRLREDDIAEVVGPVDGDDTSLRDVVAECPTGALRLAGGD
jgi:ferredoxin